MLFLKYLKILKFNLKSDIFFKNSTKKKVEKLHGQTRNPTSRKRMRTPLKSLSQFNFTCCHKSIYDNDNVCLKI